MRIKNNCEYYYHTFLRISSACILANSIGSGLDGLLTTCFSTFGVTTTSGCSVDFFLVSFECFSVDLDLDLDLCRLLDDFSWCFEDELLCLLGDFERDFDRLRSFFSRLSCLWLRWCDDFDDSPNSSFADRLVVSLLRLRLRRRCFLLSPRWYWLLSSFRFSLLWWCRLLLALLLKWSLPNDLTEFLKFRKTI